MPEGSRGRVGLAMSAADPKRVYALIDNETQQGLCRSDDLNDTWRLVSTDAKIAARPFQRAITRDGGDSWEAVTPPDLPEVSAIYEIEP